MTWWAEKAAERAAARIAPPGFFNAPGIRAHYAGIIADEIQRHHDAGCPRQVVDVKTARALLLEHECAVEGLALCSVDDPRHDEWGERVDKAEAAILAALTRNVPVTPTADPFAPQWPKGVEVMKRYRVLCDDFALTYEPVTPVTSPEMSGVPTAHVIGESQLFDKGTVMVVWPSGHHVLAHRGEGFATPVTSATEKYICPMCEARHSSDVDCPNGCVAKCNEALAQIDRGEFMIARALFDEIRNAIPPVTSDTTENEKLADALNALEEKSWDNYLLAHEDRALLIRCAAALRAAPVSPDTSTQRDARCPVCSLTVWLTKDSRFNTHYPQARVLGDRGAACPGSNEDARPYMNRAPVSREPDGEDTKRLDWLEANWGTAILPVEGNIMPRGTWCVDPATAKGEDDVFMQPTVRAAIDAARSDA